MALNPYNLDESQKELLTMQAIFELQVETQVLMQVLVEKKIVTRDEIKLHREKVKDLPKYKDIREYLFQMTKDVAYYKEHPEEHLRAVLKAKMDGKI